MKGKVFLLSILILTIILTTSCSSSAALSDNYSSRSYVPVVRKYFNSGIANKQSVKEVSPISFDINEDEPLIVLNSVIKETQMSIARILLSEADTYIGVPYRFGGTTRGGIDCSAFVKNVFETLDLELPRVSSAQAAMGIIVNVDEAKEGDLLFFANKGTRVTHVGIVHGRNEDGEIEFIHASSSQGVTVTPLSDTYWNKRFLYAKRILD